MTNKREKRFQTGGLDYDVSKEFCKNCNGSFMKSGTIYTSEGSQFVSVCTAIPLPPLNDLPHTPEELERKAKELCPHTGEVIEVYRIEGYLPGPYVECQRPVESNDRE